MKILLHMCCAPCSTYPYATLTERGFLVMGFWYNPNIHPYTEYVKRMDAVKQFSEKKGFRVLYRDSYDLEEFLRGVVYRENFMIRCRQCYYMRLKSAVIYARNGKFDYFTTSLLSSPYQNHNLIKDIGFSLAKDYGVKFYYEDFRKGWKETIKISKEMGLYRQQYCGCIYSEKERYLGVKKSAGLK